MTAPRLNVSGYRFVAVDRLPERREWLERLASGLGLKGTILLAEEGINFFLAAEEEALRDFLAGLGQDPAFKDIAVKESWSSEPPFQRLKVKIKREIVRMNMPTLRPATARPPAVSPATLARWLENGHDDEGREIAVLDTRNGFEVDAGAFEGAIDWRLEKFSDFPAAAKANLDALRDKTVVSYCTGGIRCEKAALVMQDLGLSRSYQLEGGILKYFEEAPGAPHWRGACFVFDERRLLGPTLAPEPQAASAA
jgi:UPF0176 protein